MPPLGGQTDKTFRLHYIFQQGSVTKSFRRKIHKVSVRAVGKLIEAGGHRKLMSLSVHESEVDGGAAVVPGARRGIGDVAVVRDPFPQDSLDGKGTVTIPDF